MDVKTYDFFAKGRKDFYGKFSHKSILCQGSHWEKPPFVTILITTYKRPELLRKALESALNQKGFDDYQIIIADNEGRPIEEETCTAKVVKEYQDKKVIYYRHTQEVAFRSDSAARLARSPWIVFLHDDDLLDENHLAVMTEIVKKNKKIKFLGCPAKDFVSECEIAEAKGRKHSKCKYKVVRHLKNMICIGVWVGWLGAMISRKHYIAIGGMPLLAMGCGDKVMTFIFQARFGVYKCLSNKFLYYYRRGEQQISFTQKDTWQDLLADEYYFYRYVIRKYHKFTYRFWERNMAYYILKLCENYNKGIYQTQINIDYVIKKCNMPKDVKRRGLLYCLTKVFFTIYRACIVRVSHLVS